MASNRGEWGSRLGFVLAASGSAVGLGNIWKFPYITGENGGGLFVLIYLVCIVLVGVPIMMAEIMIGRAAQKQPIAAFSTLLGRRSLWSAVGWMGVATGFIILSYYIVVAGWAVDYTVKSVINFTGPIAEEAEAAADEYVAQTSIDDMRLMLVERRTDRETPDAVRDIELEVKPSVWDAYDRFAVAVTASDDPAAARMRLLHDERLADQVGQAEALLPRIEAAANAVHEEAIAHYAAATDREIAAESGVVVRRGRIFEQINDAFAALATDGWLSTFWAALFLAITIIIVASGISGGIERTCRILVPTLITLMIVMVVYGMFQPGFGRAVSFVFKPDAGKLEPSGVLEALGHAFFTLSLGMGAMITYGSYQRSRSAGLAKESLLIAGLDTFIALLACLMIFPILFTFDQDAAAGPGLVFVSMPLAFAEIGTGGMLLAILFFGLLVFAALTSSISLLEVVASYFIDERGWSRPRAALTVGLTALLFAVPCAFSLDPDLMFTGWQASMGTDFFSTMDVLTSNWALPLGGLLIALYAGWVMPKRLRDAEVVDLPPTLYAGWLFLVRFVTPALVIVVLLQKVGVLDADELFHGLFH